MKRTVMTTDGKKDSDIELPNVFETEVNRALIHRAFINLQTHGFQKHSTKPTAGKIMKIVERVKKDRPGLGTEIEITVDIPGAAIPVDHPLAKIAQAYSGMVYEKPWEIKGAGPGNEGYMLISAGIPTLCGFGPVGGNPHAPDEWIELNSLSNTVAIFAGIISDYLSTQ